MEENRQCDETIHKDRGVRSECRQAGEEEGGKRRGWNVGHR